MIPTRYLQKTNDGVFVKIVFRPNSVTALYIPSTQISETPIYDSSAVLSVTLDNQSECGKSNTARLLQAGVDLPVHSHLGHNDWFLPSSYELHIVLSMLVRSPITRAETLLTKKHTPESDTLRHFLSSSVFQGKDERLRLVQECVDEWSVETMFYNYFPTGRLLLIRSVELM